jgi:tetratricopeptide (TPR) repeat protein
MPDMSEALVLKARILHQDMENDPEALAVLADAEERFPADSSFPELHGEILLAQGRLDDGLTALGHAHDLDPGRIDIISLLLSTTAHARQWKDAASWLALIPPESRTTEHLRLGWQVSTGLGDHAQALEFAQNLLRQTGGADAAALEARSLLSAGRQPDAMVVIDHALLAMSPPPSLASELHFLRSQAGSADSLLDLRTALKENPDNREALTTIAEALADQKDYRKATGYAKRASALAPGDTALAQRAEELSRLADSGQ